MTGGLWGASALVAGGLAATVARSWRQRALSAVLVGSRLAGVAAVAVAVAVPFLRGDTPERGVRAAVAAAVVLLALAAVWELRAIPTRPQESAQS